MQYFQITFWITTVNMIIIRQWMGVNGGGEGESARYKPLLVYTLI